MTIEWTEQALSDLGRLYRFLAATNEEVAVRTIDNLVASLPRVLDQPRRGSVLEGLPKDVRRVVIGNCELRYETRVADIRIVSAFRLRESL